MTSEDVKKLLPIIEAFANKQPLLCRSKTLAKEESWMIINPDTSEFRFDHLLDQDLEWRLER